MKRLLIFLFLLIACPAWGATRTVCGSECDYTTIAAAEAGATAGDTVNVSTGTYNENNPTFGKRLNWVAVDGNGTVTITNSGTGAYAANFNDTNIITITGVVFDGLSAKASAVQFAAGVKNVTLSYCTLQNSTTQTIRYYTGHSAIILNYCTINESDLATDTGQILLGAPVGSITNSTFNVYALNYFALLSASSNLTFTGNTVTASFSGVYPNFWDLKGTGITLTTSNNTITTAGTNAYYVNATRASTGGTVSMSDTVTLSSANYQIPFSFTTAGAWTVDLTGMNITASSSSFNKTLIGFVDQINPKVRNSTITLTTPTVTNSFTAISATSTGVDCTNGGTVSSITITNNKIYSPIKGNYIISVGTETSGAGDNKLDNALITGNRLYGYVYYDNTRTDGTVHSIFVGHNKNALIMNNLVNGGAYGVVLKGSPTVWTNGGVFYNTFVNCTGNGASVFRLKGVQGVHVYNNTSYVGTETAVGSYQLHIGENNAGQEATGNIIKNNLFIAEESPMIAIDADALTGFVSDNNLFARICGLTPKFSIDAGNTTKTYAEWQALGHDTNSVNSDPLFISATNFHLQSGSPARGAGVNVGLVHLNPPDIGAEPYLQYVPWYH